MKPRLKGFFCGGGLALIGLQQAGIEIVESNEIDAVCCRTLRRNFKHTVHEGDIRAKLVSSSVSTEIQFFTYPCNKYAGISAIHGCRTGDELYLHALRHMVIDPPEVYVLENVPGMRMFPVVMETMTKLPGYYVHAFCPVSAENWVPQRRDRLIIFGSRRPYTWSTPRKGRVTPLSGLLERDPRVTVPDYVFKRMRGEYRDLPIISDPKRGDLAPTCVAHYSKDQSTRLVRDRRFKLGVRPYTVKEYARLQGVPDSYQFAGTSNQQYKQIGNGVEVHMAEWIGRNLRRYFGDRRAA